MANTTGKKFGGRQKGTPNKISARLREVLSSILEGEIEKIPDYLNELKPRERLEVIIKLIPYVVPRVEPVNLNHLTLTEQFD